jgi:ribosome-binding protein aMBF1 (putative translation factor)
VDEPAGPSAGTAADVVEAARHELGQLPARLRKQAGLSQRVLARQTGYSASVVASAETGKPHVSVRFRQQADDQVNAGGQLTAAY